VTCDSNLGSDSINGFTWALAFLRLKLRMRFAVSKIAAISEIAIADAVLAFAAIFEIEIEDVVCVFGHF